MSDCKELDCERLEVFCKMFRGVYMRIWREGDCVMMDLPLIFSDGCMAVINTRMMPDGKVRVSDDGRIAMHEPLTPADVYEICDKHNLEYVLKDESDDLPLDCEIYKVVDRLHFHDAVFAIIKASMDARDMWG